MSTGDGGGAIGFAASAAISGAIGAAGAWVVLGLLLVVGLLLYFNMTVGDLVAAWLRRREERAELAEIEARRATDRRGRLEPVAPVPVPESRGLLDRMRSAFGGGGETDEPPLILRRARPPEGAVTAPARAHDIPIPIAGG